MKKNSNKKAITKARETKLQAIIAELSEISRKREKELAEIDRIAKMLVRRDFELAEMREKREKELKELDRIAKLLVRRDFELTVLREEQVKELREMDRIAKMLVRRDFELAEMRERREAELEELEKRTKELEKSRIALMNILEDVEEARGKAEEEKEKTLAVITNFADGLLVFDKQGKLILINPQAEDFFETKLEKIIGKSIFGLSQSPNFQPLTNLLRRKIKNIFREELAIKENLILEISTLPIFRGKEKIGTLMILHDVTREKRIEQLKTEFVSISAHQLRTPLSAIKWTLRMLLDGDLGRITKEQKDFLEKTYQSNERMINLINDLLDVTRIEEGRYLYKPTLTDLEKLLKEVVKSYQEEAKRKKLNLEFQKPKAKLPKVLVDIEKMKLALQNLVENAVRYTPDGGRVTISLKLAKKELEFSIKDTGMGIPEDQQTRIFTKFFRGANVIRTETEGTGLGLFITKNIIEAHNGKIWFESKEGKGSTFHFTLPLKK